MSDVTEVTVCEICGHAPLLPVLDLGAHPLCDDLVPLDSARKCAEYPIDIYLCTNCITAYQRFNVPKRELFPRSYHYRARFTADVLNGMQGLVRSCEEQFGSLKGKKVVDIGCNDGSLLGFFREAGATTIGIEPTGAAEDAASRVDAVFNDYLSPSVAASVVAAHGKPDFITFTNVFAHIENLGEVLDSLRVLMAPHTVIVIENHYLGAIIQGNQFDTFYHEHPRTYSLASFRHIAKSLGARLLKAEFTERYGGNIRVYLAAGGASAETHVPDVDESGFAEAFSVLARNMATWRETKKHQLAEHVRRHGKLRAKAFPGRAAILVKLLDLDDSMISAVYEKPGSMKIGHYLPGTRIPIRSDDELFALPDQDAPILNFAWHIPKEIREYFSKHGYSGNVIDVVASEDFRS